MTINGWRSVLDRSMVFSRRLARGLFVNPRSSQLSRDSGRNILQHEPSVGPAREVVSSSSAPASLLIQQLGRPLMITRGLGGEPVLEKDIPDLEERLATDYPGAKTNFIAEMQFIPPTASTPVPCYRILDDFGQPLPAAQVPEVDAELARKMYVNMVTLQAMDVIFYEAQRQGRFSFYVTTLGEEAINIATSAALNSEDIIYSQYREPGMLMWRGFTLQDYANQCFGNLADLGKGRQMPCHYGSRDLNFLTVSSPIATQIPQAVGAAYGLKMQNKTASAPACTVTLFGDGGTSEGDFHAGLNFAATLETPTLFVCRNNGWAISTPVTDQFKSDGVVVKGQAYGVCSIRVDGNDALAVYAAIKAARKMAIEESRPILIEALTYRVGHHSTSDDSSKYRKRDEINHWKMHHDPVLRFKRWMEGQGWWDSESETTLRSTARKEVISALTKAGQMQKPDLYNLFTDVYDTVPSHLKEQEKRLREVVAKCPVVYPRDVAI